MLGQVNAHYDLAVCTEEIIGVIGLGQRFGVQDIPEADNQEHRDRQFLLKRRRLGSDLQSSLKSRSPHCTPQHATTTVSFCDL